MTVMAISITGIIVDKYPRESPYMMFIAGPEKLALAISYTGK